MSRNKPIKAEKSKPPIARDSGDITNGKERSMGNSKNLFNRWLFEIAKKIGLFILLVSILYVLTCSLSRTACDWVNTNIGLVIFLVLLLVSLWLVLCLYYHLSSGEKLNMTEVVAILGLLLSILVLFNSILSEQIKSSREVNKEGYENFYCPLVSAIDTSKKYFNDPTAIFIDNSNSSNREIEIQKQNIEKLIMPKISVYATPEFEDLFWNLTTKKNLTETEKNRFKDLAIEGKEKYYGYRSGPVYIVLYWFRNLNNTVAEIGTHFEG